jgi:aryl-alcohol dehydrogenase-like predicted oxidoreductase
MDYRTIPGTDLTVSLLAFGNFIFGTNWWGEYSDDEGVAIQNRAVDQGVTFFDTAPAYGNGRAESLMAETICYAGRENLVLSTKFGYDLPRDPGQQGGHRERKQNFSSDFIRQDLEASLKRMDTAYIDLYQAHNLKLHQYTDELFETLQALKDEGKIRAWGVALGPAIGWREEGHQAFLDHDAATVQTVMNLYEQDPGREFCEVAAHRGRGGVIARVPTNSGILDEEFDDPNYQFPEWDHRKFRDRDWLVYGLKKNEIIRPMAEKLGMSIREFAIRWLASQPGMVSIEPNIYSQAEVDDFVHACDGRTLPDEVLQDLQALYERDFDLGEGAHPCPLKSSTAEEGEVRSGYVSPTLTR